MKKLALKTGLALAAMLLFVVGAMAAEGTSSTPAAGAPATTSGPMTTAPSGTMETFTGVVHKVDEHKGEVWVKSGGKEMTFSWGANTKFSQGDKMLTSNDLKKGMHVSVGYTKEGDKMMAQSVNVMPRVAKKGSKMEKGGQTEGGGSTSGGTGKY